MRSRLGVLAEAFLNRGKSTPRISDSWRSHLAPMPNRKRPPENASSVAEGRLRIARQDGMPGRFIDTLSINRRIIAAIQKRLDSEG